VLKNATLAVREIHIIGSAVLVVISLVDSLVDCVAHHMRVVKIVKTHLIRLVVISIRVKTSKID
jgi:hypothetical protein